jgi:hypothetical protein
MKSTQLYDFTLAAGGSQVILADANFYKILTATGDLKITRDGGSTVRPMRAGRGEREVEFKSLIVTDISGAPNSGTIVVGDSNFIDDTIVLSSAINVRPEVQSGFFNDQSGFTANTPLTVFAPASNVNGAIVDTAQIGEFSNTNIIIAFIAKASAPASVIDGTPVLSSAPTGSISTNIFYSGNLPKSIYLAAGQGLYLICNATIGATGVTVHACRYKLL